MMNALATIAMELMQNYDKDDGLRGIDDVNRWPVESWPFKFLEATTIAVSVEQLKHVRQELTSQPSPEADTRL